MTTLYFAYGANLSKEDMLVRCPDATPYRKLILRGWTLEFATFATILPYPGKSVQGALWKLTEKCEDALDGFEGFPTMYTKRYLAQDGLTFMAYKMNNPQFQDPSLPYLDTIRRGYRDWNLDSSTLDELREDIVDRQHQTQSKFNQLLPPQPFYRYPRNR